MALIIWEKDLSVKVDEFDDQHKKLIDIINTLHETMGDGDSKAAIEKIVSSLCDYIKYHFAAEERMMEERGYAGLPDHKAEHKKLIQNVLDFHARLLDGTTPLTDVSLMYFLRDWLMNHIRKTDKLYSIFLGRNNVA